MSGRQRTKSVEKAQSLIPEARVLDYAIGREGLHPALVVGGIIVLFAALSGVLFAATGGFVMPGIIAVLVLQHLVSPPRGLAICDRGVAITDRSLWNGKPGKVVALAEFAHIWPARHRVGRTEVTLGPVKVWLSGNEERHLRAALADAQAGLVDAYA